MPKYQCPECEAVLRREEPVAEGKKIRCPKCETLFIAEPVRDRDEPKPKKKKPAPAPEPEKKKKPPAKKPAGDDDDEEGGTYGVAADVEDAGNKKNRDVEYGSLRDKYEKSTRGPAMALVVGPSNGMLAVGILVGFGSMLGVMALLWPYIFSEDPPTGRDSRNQVLKIVGCVLGMVYGACTCYAASKLHELLSFGWSIAGTVLTGIVGATFAILGLIGVFQTIRGFTADPEEVVVEKIEEGHKIARGKTTSVGTGDLTMETSDKKTLSLRIVSDTRIYKYKDKKARSVDLRDGIPVKIEYVPEGQSGQVVVAIIDPEDGEPDDTMTLMFMMIGSLVVLAFGAFGCTITSRAVQRLKNETVQEGFEETLTARDY